MAQKELRVSPSLLGHFFEVGQCERFLGFRAAAVNRAIGSWWIGDRLATISEAISLELDRRSSRTLPSGAVFKEQGQQQRQPLAKGGVVSAAHIEAGIAWEQQLLGRLKKDQWKVFETRDGRIGEPEVIELLKREEPALSGKPTLLYQPTLVAPKRLYAKLGVDPETLVIPPCYPDFVAIRAVASGVRDIFVIDAKGSRDLKLSHRVQVAVYTLVLEALVEEHGIAGISVADHAAVWLRGAPTFESFAVHSSRLAAADALRRVASWASPLSAIEDLPCRLGPRCETCEFLEFCEKRAISHNDLNLVHGVSEEDVDLVESLALARNVSADVALGVLSSASSAPKGFDVKQRIASLKSTLEAFCSGTPKLRNAGSMSFSMKDDFSCHLSLLVDGPTTRFCGFAILATAETNQAKKLTENMRGRIPGSSASPEGDEVSFASASLAGPQCSNSRALARALVGSLFSILDTLASHNASVSWQSRVGVKLFVFDSFEASILESILWAMSSPGPASGGDISEALGKLSLDDGEFTEKESEEASHLLATLFAGRGSLVNSRAIPDISENSGTCVSVLQTEISRLVALRLFSHRLSLAEHARALGCAPAADGEKPIGTRDILEHWTAACSSRTDEAGLANAGHSVASALLETARTCRSMVASLRALLKGSPQSTRIPTRSKSFVWAKPLPCGLSLTRRRCAFAALHELYLSSERQRSVRASLPLQDQLEQGNFFLADIRIDPATAASPEKPKSPEKKKKIEGTDAGAPPATPEKASPTKQRGTPLKTRAKSKATFRAIGRPITRTADKELCWWLVPRAGPEADADIEKTLTAMTEFRDLFSARYWFTPEAWVRVGVDTVSDDGMSGTLSSLSKFPTSGGPFVMLPATFDLMTPSLFKVLACQPPETPEDISLERILDSPATWAHEPFSESATAAAQQAISLLDSGFGPVAQLTASQVTAVRRAISSHVQIIWGPPGTGKTHVISALALLLVEAHHRAFPASDKPFRVLAIALTNSNIAHLLRTICSLRNSIGPKSRLPVARLDAASGLAIDFDTGEGTKPQAFCRANPIAVIGATVWQVRKAFEPGDDDFDLLLWDDASQSRAVEVGIPHSLLRRRSGRLVVAGDPLQLPPIISGSYGCSQIAIAGLAERRRLPAPSTSKSVFECLADGDPERSFVSVLSENWRMNAGLCEFLGSALYNKNSCGMERPYAPASPEVSGAVLQISDPAPGALQGFEAAASIVVFILRSSGRAILEQDCPERGIVGKLVSELYSLVPGTDEDFWKEVVMVLAPHHFQRVALLSELVSQGLGGNAVVETVERAQGQERDVAIVDYALFSKERVSSEATFVYSVNRMNVCVSRARKKCFFLVSDIVLTGCESTFDQEPSQRGFKFIHSIVEFARSRKSVFEVKL